ncbi:MAG: ribosome small subunit-dependent GTPase A [Epsilonproteobacteria bacterium]|nr:ribosome small subunit-dependent GTPase A [Campylobacterota bacterium]NPA57570.1 ribosome small subunit-dependent GTPase A [Campylobacterota bacterium]
MRALVTYRSANNSKVTIPESGQVYNTILRSKVKRDGLFAGDWVEGELNQDKFVVERVEERKNLLKRPPVANVDNVLIVMAMRNPDFDNYLLDNFLAVYGFFGIEPVIIFNKIDLLEDREELERWLEIYRGAGYRVDAVTALEGEGLQRVREYIEGEISILAGPSGVGKSSILSNLLGIEIKVGEVSEKLGRGRHTTTAVTLYPFGRGSFVADTPGFSRVEATYFMEKREVRLYFREFHNYQCRYPDCTHTSEPECGVQEAVRRGSISCYRFKSYLKIMGYYWEELESICSFK